MDSISIDNNDDIFDPVLEIENKMALDRIERNNKIKKVQDSVIIPPIKKEKVCKKKKKKKKKKLPKFNTYDEYDEYY